MRKLLPCPRSSSLKTVDPSARSSVPKVSVLPSVSTVTVPASRTSNVKMSTSPAVKLPAVAEPSGTRVASLIEPLWSSLVEPPASGCK